MLFFYEKELFLLVLYSFVEVGILLFYFVNKENTCLKTKKTIFAEVEIKRLKRAEIDDKVWNGCVHFAINALPYAYTWYLDIVCEEWEGLVLGDYKAVMPLVFKKKMGIAYLYQPFSTQQLGVFTALPITKKLIHQFIEQIPKEYKYIAITLNEINDISEEKEVSILRNYYLDLNLDYALIKTSYNKNLLRNLRKAEKNELLIQNNISPETLVDFYVKHTAPKLGYFKEKNKYMLYRLVYKAQAYQVGFPVAISNKNNELVAVNFFLSHPTRLINLLPASSAEGKQLLAMPFLLDYVIQRNANQKKILDFEGSMQEGVARFYKGFGAQKVNYYAYKRNNLPFFLRIFKK